MYNLQEIYLKEELTQKKILDNTKNFPTSPLKNDKIIKIMKPELTNILNNFDKGLPTETKICKPKTQRTTPNRKGRKFKKINSRKNSRKNLKNKKISRLSLDRVIKEPTKKRKQKQTLGDIYGKLFDNYDEKNNPISTKRNGRNEPHKKINDLTLDSGYGFTISKKLKNSSKIILKSRQNSTLDISQKRSLTPTGTPNRYRRKTQTVLSERKKSNFQRKKKIEKKNELKMINDMQRIEELIQKTSEELKKYDDLGKDFVKNLVNKKLKLDDKADEDERIKRLNEKKINQISRKALKKMRQNRSKNISKERKKKIKL